MQIFVKTLTGKILTIETEPSETIKEIQQKIQEMEGTAVGKQVFIFDKKQINDTSKTLADYDITAESTIYLVLRLRIAEETE